MVAIGIVSEGASAGKPFREVGRQTLQGNASSQCMQKDYRTELYYFRIIYGNSCSVMTEPIRFWN